VSVFGVSGYRTICLTYFHEKLYRLRRYISYGDLTLL